MSVWITESHVVTGFGNLSDSWQAICRNESAIQAIDRFDTSGYTSTLGSFCKHLSPRSDGHSLIHSLIDMLLEQCAGPYDVPLVVTATTKAGIDNLAPVLSHSSGDPDDILPHTLSALVGQKLGIPQFTGFNVSAACVSSTVALARVAAMIDSGLYDSAIICSVDLLTEFVFAGFSSLRILSEKPCRPYDSARCGLSLGEGASFFHLASEQIALQSGLPCKGIINGWSITNDAYHIVSPSPDGRGVVSAIRTCLDSARLTPSHIGAVSGHGTGTMQNDAMEMEAFKSVFCFDSPPIYGIKGAVGHCLGATGGIEVAIALEVLDTLLVPPTVGFEKPPQSTPLNITTTSVPLTGRHVLVTNSGFGGVNCCLVMSRGNA